MPLPGEVSGVIWIADAWIFAGYENRLTCDIPLTSELSKRAVIGRRLGYASGGFQDHHGPDVSDIVDPWIPAG